MGKTDPGYAEQAHLSPAPKGRSARCRIDQGLHLVESSPFQEAGLQELFQHLPSLINASPVEHPLLGGGERPEAGVPERGP